MDNDLIFGDQGRDGLSGGKGDDTFINGQEDDTLKGGRGEDVFGFDNQYNHGNDTITDFEDGKDTINLFKSPCPNDDWMISGEYADSFDDLTITQSGNDTVITFNGGAITLGGIQSSQITKDNFSFEFLINQGNRLSLITGMRR